MAQLIVRNIDDSIAERLRRRAAAAGVSMEEEHRRILRKALGGTGTFKEMLLAVPNVGEDEDFERMPQRNREIDL